MNTATANAATLTEYDFIVCVDASGSMGETDTNGRSRWDNMQETAVSFTRDVCALDSDGIGVVVFSGQGVTAQDHCDVEAVRKIFAERGPRGSTPLAEALTSALSLKSTKKAVILVFTDGVPDDEKAVARVIREQAARQATDEECTFLFVQVGNDAHATKYLDDLDNHLTGAKFDIVCAKTVEEANKFASTVDLVAYAIAN